MDGCEIYAITGIDGDPMPAQSILKSVSGKIHFLLYDRNISFQKNADIMQQKICSSKSTNIVIFGWSIGGAMALRLANFCTRCISINAFSNRRQYLFNRNITISDDDDFNIDELDLRGKEILLIAGGSDEKIPYTNSIKIYERLKKSNRVILSIFSDLPHSLVLFSKEAKSTITAFITGIQIGGVYEEHVNNRQ